ncbi:MAG: hypothetical protein ACOYL5_06295 [Phototrophicaceae bacterium]
MSRWISVADQLYRAMVPMVNRTDAQVAHSSFIAALRLADAVPPFWGALQPNRPLEVGGVVLPSPFILAAGLVKGDGFADEGAAMDAVQAGRNIIPGWRTMPALAGAVEFGSFTRYPRLGNAGRVLWRDGKTRSTQNRVGLRNPGIEAAIAFLIRHRKQLPAVYGINIAVTPGLEDADQEAREVQQATEIISSANIAPSWVTLNISCPNTEDDPAGHQTEEKATRLCKIMVREMAEIPVWVKVSPNLAREQYAALMSAFREARVRGVIATNTVATPTPTGDGMAGLGGGGLHRAALAAVQAIQAEQTDPFIDVIGCGGIMDQASINPFAALGVQAFQYYSALIYRGLLAATILNHEYRPE